MQRLRDKSQVTSGIGIDNLYDSSGNLLGGYPREFPLSVVQPDTMSDIVTPGFKRISATGGIVISPMTKLKGTQTMDGSGSLVGASYRYEWYGAWMPIDAHGAQPWKHPKVEEAILRTTGLAVTDAFGGVGSPDVATLTELVELRDTLGFLTSPVRAMVKLTQRFKRHLNKVTAIEERYARRIAKWDSLPPRIQARRAKPEKPKLPTFKSGKYSGTDVASAWLAYRYGLMPLIYTFQDVVKLLKKQSEGAPLRVTSRAKSNQVVDLSTSSETVDSAYGVSYSFTRAATGSATVTSRAGVLYEQDLSLQASLGLQWNRIPIALYEGIPLSFVTDWFHNGASVYDALTAELRAKRILGAWVTTVVEYDVLYRDTYGPAISGGTCTGIVSSTVKGTYKTRVPASQKDVSFRLRVELNAKRVADGLALISTFLATARKK